MTLTLNWLPLGQGLVLALSYLGLALGYVPGLRMNRATIALVSAAVLVALGTLSIDQAWAAIDANTIVFLLSMMVVNAYLSYAGFFGLALVQLLRLTRSPLGLLVLLPIAVVGLALQVGLLWLLYPEVRSLTPCPPPLLPRLRLHRPLLVKTTLVSALLLAAFIVGLPLAESAFLAAATLLVTRRIKPERVLGAVDWSLLVLFSGLFILTEAVRSLQVLDSVAPWVAHPAGLLVVTAGLSNLISNVPAVLLIQGLIAPGDTQSWLLLAAGSTLAGNLTLFGSVANLITVEAAAAEGHGITFWPHLRFGLPLTVITLAITYLWVA